MVPLITQLLLFVCFKGTVNVILDDPIQNRCDHVDPGPGQPKGDS